MFDTAASRAVDSEHLELIKHVKMEERKQKRKTGVGAEKELKKAPKWKVDRARFLSMIRSSKGPTASGSSSGAGGGDDFMDGVTEEDMDDRVECPHCHRKFNKQSAEKHIRICQNLANRPGAVLRKGMGRAAGGGAGGVVGFRGRGVRGGRASSSSRGTAGRATRGIGRR